MFDFSLTSKFEDFCLLFHYCVGTEKKIYQGTLLKEMYVKTFPLPCPIISL